MRPFAVLTIGIIVLALVPLAQAAPSWALTVNPGYPVTQGTTMTLTLTLAGGSNNRAYDVVIGVTKPNNTGQASTARTFSTDNRGSGGITLPYPDPSFTPVNGTVATDVGGVYTVQVNQTGPSFQSGIATAQFTVISQLTVVPAQPAAGSYVQRGQKLTITATVSNPGGPVTTATVSANAPGSLPPIYMQQISSGIYSTDYTVPMYAPTGTWTIMISAFDPSGNSGSSTPIDVTVTTTDIVVDSLTTYNAKGTATLDFSPGDSVYPFFRLKYSTGDFLTKGQYRVAVRNPDGHDIVNLTAVYDSSRFGFYTTTGYQFSQFDPAGSWTVAITEGSVDDGFGNTGPSYTTSVKIQIATISSPWSYLPFAIGGMLAVVSGAFLFKRYDRSKKGFEYLERLMGGQVPRGASILILGDPGSGKSILSYEFLHEELENGRFCAVLSYDAFPEDVQARMLEFGWNITNHLRKGRLKIVDCYSGLAGEGEGAIKDPSDLTELNIRVTSIIAHAKGKPVTLVLDSLTPIFNGVEPKQAITFIQTIGAKIKKTDGVFFLTGTTGAVPADALAKAKSFMDGIIELSLVRHHREITRFLTVTKMERRKISTETVRFEIDRRKGFAFHVSRLKTSLQSVYGGDSENPERTEKPSDPRKIPNPDKTKLPDASQKSVMTPQTTQTVPQWGKRDQRTEEAIRKPVEVKGPTSSIIDRLKAASDRLWGVPPSTDKHVNLVATSKELTSTNQRETPALPNTLKQHEGQQPSTATTTPERAKPAPAPQPQPTKTSPTHTGAAELAGEAGSSSKTKSRDRLKEKHEDGEKPSGDQSKSSADLPGQDSSSSKTPAASSG